MHKKATEALEKKVAGLLNNGEITEEGDFSDGAWERFEDLAANIFKEKRKWVTKRDALTLVISETLRVLPRLGTTAAKNFSIAPGKFSDLVDLKTAQNSILKAITSIPYQYIVFFELPRLSIPDNPEIKFTAKTKLCRIPHNKVRNSKALPVEEGDSSYYLTTIVEGYCGRSINSPAIQSAFNTLKVVTARLISNDFLWAGERENSYGSPQSARRPTVAFHRRDEHEGFHRFEVDLPDDVGRLLSVLESDRIEADLTMLRRLLAVSYDSSKSILTSCEWAFDALAEENSAMAVVKTCVGLESIYGENNFEGGITKSLADRCAYSVAISHQHRKAIYEVCKDIYSLRSSIVHGVKHRLGEEDEDLKKRGASLLDLAITNEIRLLVDL